MNARLLFYDGVESTAYVLKDDEDGLWSRQKRWWWLKLGFKGKGLGENITCTRL
jgi:hypothetical protein